MLIRPATIADLPALTAIYNREIETGTATMDLEPYTIEERRAWLEAHNRGNHPLWVAEIDGVAAGYVSLSTFNAKPAYSTTVELSLYVAGGFRRRGVGLALAQAMLDWARADAATHRVVSLVTAENTASRALHERLGFRFVGTMTQAGFKFGRFLDVDFWELAV